MFIEKLFAAGAPGAVDANSFQPFQMASANNVDLVQIGVSVTNWILTAAAILAVIFLIYSGILYLTAAGNEANADKGKKGIINSIIGIIIIVLALVIIRVTNNAAVNAVAPSNSGVADNAADPMAP